MKDAKVIEFPKEKSSRVLLRNRLHDRKAALGVSIASVFIVALMMNQVLTKKSELDVVSSEGNRGVASYDASSFAKDVKWEQDLAKTMSRNKEMGKVTLAHSPSLRDELVFGFLEGKYGMRTTQGQIKSLEFINSQAGDQPMEISDKGHFLKKYAEAFGHSFSEVSLSAQDDSKMVYSLIDANKSIVGTVSFEVDTNGRVYSIKFLN